jgi:glucose-6-phosphate isomerase, archaeal
MKTGEQSAATMKTRPFAFDLPAGKWIPSEYDNYIKRTLSSMHGQYLDQQAYMEALNKADSLLYEAYEIKRPEVAGELLQGLSIIHPGKVGDEYFMTKGHYHTVRDTGEVYYCLHGEGVMVMETEEGEWAVEEFRPGRVLYVLPDWAHRSVNTSLTQDLIFFFAYPGNAGHDYGTIEKQGFRKLIMEQNGKPKVIDNPRWHAPGR